MKLAKIVLPLTDNKGVALFEEHEHLKHALLVKFGGYTRTAGHGAWLKDASTKTVVYDTVAIYEVAMERAAVTELRSLIGDFAAQCRQESVMIVTPCGDVEFIKPHLPHLAVAV